MSRLNYCNSLYAHCNVSTQRLQVFKIVSRTFFSTSCHAHRLYLYYNNYIGCQLKLEYHTNCVLLCIVAHGTAPLYLVELCQPCSDTRLRSASRSYYNVPRTYRRFTNSSFSISAPTVWNCLPSRIHSSATFSSFLTRLKTQIINTSFSALQHVT